MFSCNFNNFPWRSDFMLDHHSLLPCAAYATISWQLMNLCWPCFCCFFLHFFQLVTLT